jgi:hypothetical protein
LVYRDKEVSPLYLEEGFFRVKRECSEISLKCVELRLDELGEKLMESRIEDKSELKDLLIEVKYYYFNRGLKGVSLSEKKLMDLLNEEKN